MCPQGGHAPDWTSERVYAPLLAADRTLWAWEWLRRNPSYRAAANRALEPQSAGALDCGAALPRPEEWGLHAFEQPSSSVPDARPVWRRAFLPHVLTVTARPGRGADDLFLLERLETFATVITDASSAEHLLLSDGFRTLRMDVISGTLMSGTVRLSFQFEGLNRLEAPLLALRQLLALWQTGQLSRRLHPAETRSQRWILMLRAHDGLAAGAGQRELAERLISTEAAAPRWRVRVPSVRSRMQRLVREAARMAAGGYLSLLAGRRQVWGTQAAIDG